jgi:hypothetical protein
MFACIENVLTTFKTDTIALFLKVQIIISTCNIYNYQLAFQSLYSVFCGSLSFLRLRQSLHPIPQLLLDVRHRRELDQLLLRHVQLFVDRLKAKGTF